MGLSNNQDRILAALRLSSFPLDDDELAKKAGVQPRQTVNQICRALALQGALQRYRGRDGKIVNELTDDDAHRSSVDVAGLPPAITTAPPNPELPPGNSTEQRQAERIMLDLFGQRLGIDLNPLRLTVPSGARVEIDGADTDRSVLVECWAHQGPPKSAQKHKVLADALKLTWIASTLYPRPRLFLCLSDPLAAAPFRPGAKSWSARALADLAITVELVELPAATRSAILQAQARQFR